MSDTPRLDAARKELAGKMRGELNHTQTVQALLLLLADNDAPSGAPVAAEELLVLEEEKREALNHLAGCVWYLLEKHNLMPEGAYAFPDGDTWSKEDLAQWKAAGHKTL